MDPQWDDTLLRASLRRVESWWSEHHLMSLGVTAVVELAVSLGFLGLVGVAQGLASLIVVPIVMFLGLVVHTHLRMVREARQAIGALLAPESAVDEDPSEASIRNFRCELVEDAPAGHVLLRVRNQDAAGEFSAKVVSVDGVDTNGTWPITARWLADPEARSRPIGRGDAEVLNLVRVRTKRAVDFLRPTSSSKEYQRVAATENGSAARVRAQLRVFNRRDDIEGHVSCALELVFPNGGDEPEARLISEPDARPTAGAAADPVVNGR